MFRLTLFTASNVAIEKCTVWNGRQQKSQIEKSLFSNQTLIFIIIVTTPCSDQKKKSMKLFVFYLFDNRLSTCLSTVFENDPSSSSQMNDNLKKTKVFLTFIWQSVFQSQQMFRISSNLHKPSQLPLCHRFKLWLRLYSNPTEPFCLYLRLTFIVIHCRGHKC